MGFVVASGIFQAYLQSVPPLCQLVAHCKPIIASNPLLTHLWSRENTCLMWASVRTRKNTHVVPKASTWVGVTIIVKLG